MIWKYDQSILKAGLMKKVTNLNSQGFNQDFNNLTVVYTYTSQNTHRPNC